MHIFSRCWNGHIIKMMNNISHRNTYLLKSVIGYSFFSPEEMPGLLDLPDEMILAIFNQVKPEMIFSMIGTGNTRLEQLALSKCHIIDFTLNSYHHQRGPAVGRFYLYVLPYISNHFQSLTLNLTYLLHVDTIVRSSIGKKNDV